MLLYGVHMRNLRLFSEETRKNPLLFMKSYYLHVQMTNMLTNCN